MSMDFTVIQPVRQRFGDEFTDLEAPIEQEAPFVGKSKDFRFSCPNIATGEMGVLQFESLAVSYGPRYMLSNPSNADYPSIYRDRNLIQINGFDIPGGITPGPMLPGADDFGIPLWRTHSLIVPNAVLKEANVLHIESLHMQQGPGNQFDNFIIDNVVVFFKTRAKVQTAPKA